MLRASKARLSCVFRAGRARALLFSFRRSKGREARGASRVLLSCARATRDAGRSAHRAPCILSCAGAPPFLLSDVRDAVSRAQTAESRRKKLALEEQAAAAKAEGKKAEGDKAGAKGDGAGDEYEKAEHEFWEQEQKAIWEARQRAALRMQERDVVFDRG